MILKILSTIILFIIILYVWLLKPYMHYDYMRISDTPTTIIAEYYTVTGEPLCTKFYKIENGKLTTKGISPNMPFDIPDPHSLTEFKDGDRITLTGFTYEWWATNLITNNIQKRDINMIDVITMQVSDSVIYKTKALDKSPKAFKHENYTNCRV